MDLGTGDRRGLISAMNIVPLIDILLVLLIIFMVISPSTPVGLTAQIPQPDAASPPPPPTGTIVVRVLAVDNLRINQDAVSWQDLGSRLEAIFSQRAEKVAFIEGGNSVEFAEVARAIGVMRAAGVEKVGLISGNLGVAR